MLDEGLTIRRIGERDYIDAIDDLHGDPSSPHRLTHPRVLLPVIVRVHRFVAEPEPDVAPRFVEQRQSALRVADDLQFDRRFVTAVTRNACERRAICGWRPLS